MSGIRLQSHTHTLAYFLLEYAAKLGECERDRVWLSELSSWWEAKKCKGGICVNKKVSLECGKLLVCWFVNQCMRRGHTPTRLPYSTLPFRVRKACCYLTTGKQFSNASLLFSAKTGLYLCIVTYQHFHTPLHACIHTNRDKGIAEIVLHRWGLCVYQLKNAIP